MVTNMNQCDYFTKNFNRSQMHAQLMYNIHQKAVMVCSQLKQHGVHSSNRMKIAGFQYTGVGDTARCHSCNLEISGWIREMDPFSIHLERNPNCAFVRSVQIGKKSTRTQMESPAKRQKTESTTNQPIYQNILIELEILKQVRRRTFSHWNNQTTPTKEQMITAGFFQCNTGDRVICLYCNLICQQWRKDIDDPIEIHKCLSPKCPYVVSLLAQENTTSVLVVNGTSTDNQTTLLNNTSQVRLDQIVYTTPCHTAYISIINRQATFENWTNELSPSADDLVRAGFFYTGNRNIVTCFYCNGSLQNWPKKDNPLIEHIRWFPHCPYAKQLAGDDLYNKIQAEKRFPQEYQRSQASTESANRHRLQIADEKLLSRLVAARLDLPVSHRLLDQDFKLSVIKRCWEDQLQLKGNDFVSDCDLFIACVILQKQIDCIKGNKDNIVIPSIKVRSLQNNEQSSASSSQQSQSSSSMQISPSTDAPNNSLTIVKTASAESVPANSTDQQITMDEIVPETKSLINNPCVLCEKEEKRLACIPCGHLAACVTCSQTLRTCPICRRGIEAFVRIYL